MSISPNNKNESANLAQQLQALSGSASQYMSHEMTAIFKSHLENMRDELMQAQELALQVMRNTDEDRPVDQLDAAQKQEDAEREQTRAAQRKTALTKINAALRLINDDEYGFCTVCGTEIGVKRLVAQPFSVMDIHCATSHEKKQQIKTAGHVGMLALS